MLTYLPSNIPLCWHILGCVHLLVHLKLLFTRSSSSSQTPTDQRQAGDSRANQTPLLSFASEPRLHWKHEERWAFICFCIQHQYICFSFIMSHLFFYQCRLEKCSAGTAAGRKGKEDQKSSWSSRQRSVQTSEEDVKFCICFDHMKLITCCVVVVWSVPESILPIFNPTCSMRRHAPPCGHRFLRIKKKHWCHYFVDEVIFFLCYVCSTF